MRPSATRPSRPSSGPSRLVVVSAAADLPGVEGVVTANEFLSSERAPTVRTTVVNLCRSLRYLSKGYYVSLLADARGMRPLPSVDVLKALGNAHAVFRGLQEADVPTVTPAEMGQRRRAAGLKGSRDVLVKEAEEGVEVFLRPPGAGETAEVTVCLGRSSDPAFQKLATSVWRVWPAPLLRLRLLREEETWKVVHLAPASIHRLREGARATLLEELRRPARSDGSPPAPPRDKRVSIAVLYDEEDRFGPSTTETVEKLERVASRMGVHVHRIGLGEIGRLGDYDALLIRTLTGLNEPAFRFATRAEALGMPVVDDTQSIIRCSNKVFLHELLRREGIPTPRTVVAVSTTPFEALERALGIPFILKLPDGSFSTAVHKVASRAEYRQVAREMFRASPLLVAQAFTPTPFDWRVGVLGGKALFVCKYHMAGGHWQIRSADARGVRYGKVEAVARDYAPREVVRLARRAAALIGDGFYGVDLKQADGGVVVIEVNDNPNLDVGYDDAADGNVIYEEIVQHFVDRVEARAAPAAPRHARRSAADAILRALRRPIGPRTREAPRTGYRAYEVCGLELEYAVVDRDLNVAHLVEPVLAALAGHPTSDVALGSVGLSNEIFDHVLEIKVPVPTRSLVDSERWLAEAVRRLSALLQDHFDARLMPTGMHPWFDPRKARIWTRSNTAIYESYGRLFDVGTHGWANVQASHVNLPLGREEDAVAMMNAAALLVPYLPAVAASSPMVGGEIHPAVDNRIAFLLEHQARIPESIGSMVPEYVRSLRQYRKEVLAPMYAAVDRLEDAKALRHEFLNARGSVFKFSRQSMEVRVLDMQECVRMDVAVAAFVRWALKALAGGLRAGRIAPPDHDVLARDFREVVRHGSLAFVAAPHLREGRADEPVAVRTVLEPLLARARRVARADERPYLDLVAGILEQGSLSERIAARLIPHAEDEDAFTDAARRLYVELTECLRANEPWRGRAS